MRPSLIGGYARPTLQLWTKHRNVIEYSSRLSSKRPTAQCAFSSGPDAADDLRFFCTFCAVVSLVLRPEHLTGWDTYTGSNA